MSTRERRSHGKGRDRRLAAGTREKRSDRLADYPTAHAGVMHLGPPQCRAPAHLSIGH